MQSIRLSTLAACLVVLAGLSWQQASAQPLSFFQRLGLMLVPDPRCPSPPKFEYTASRDMKLEAQANLAKIYGTGQVTAESKTVAKSVLENYKGDLGELWIDFNNYYAQCIIIVTTESDPQKTSQRLQLLREQFKPPGASTKTTMTLPNAGWVTVAMNGASESDVQSALDRIAGSKARKKEWQDRWFVRGPDGRPLTAKGCYHVIVASPVGAQAADLALARYSLLFPEAYFEIWEKEGNQHLAVTAGIGLSQAKAKELVAVLTDMGLKNPKPYLWQWDGPGASCT